MYVSPLLLRARVVLIAILLCALNIALRPSNAAAQPGMPTGANYTDDMPSVAKVESTIQGTDATDTAARQVTVFDYLITYINRVKDPSAPYSPSEAKLVGDYNTASTQIKQSFAKSHTPDQVKSFSQLQGHYLFDDTFMSAWPKQLIGAQAQAAIQNADAQAAASAQRMYNQQMQQYQQAQQPQSQTGIGTGQAGLMTNDPTAVSIRRCLELGGTTGSCMGGGLFGGLISMFTGGAGLGDLAGPSRAGVVLSGDYGASQTAAYVSFSGDSAAINNCGKLVPDNVGYTLRKAPNSLQVTLSNTPQPILLTMRSDGSLTGPGAVGVAGRIITGYQTTTTTQMINGVRAAPGQCNGPCQTVSQVPVYAAATNQCTLGTLSAPPPPAPASNDNSAPMGGMLGALMTSVASVVPGPLSGLRMAGKYSSSGLQFDFAGDAVTLDCGQAHVKSPYTVENAASALIVHVKNPGGPFDLTVSSDNTLRGSGATTVNGRLVSAVNGDNVTFTPHSETCQIGSYSPQSGAASTTTVAANASPMPPPAAPASSAGAQAGIRLMVESSFTGPNPLANQSIFVMKEPIAQVLRELGVSVPSSATGGQAMEALKTQCHAATGCSSAMSGLARYFVTTAKLDATGKATLTAAAATGTYYIYAIVPQGTAALVWDVPASVQAGDTSVMLTAANSEQVP